MKGFVGESQSLSLPLPVGKALTYSAMLKPGPFLADIKSVARLFHME